MATCHLRNKKEPVDVIAGLLVSIHSLVDVDNNNLVGMDPFSQF